MLALSFKNARISRVERRAEILKLPLRSHAKRTSIRHAMHFVLINSSHRYVRPVGRIIHIHSTFVAHSNVSMSPSTVWRITTERQNGQEARTMCI